MGTETVIRLLPRGGRRGGNPFALVPAPIQSRSVGAAPSPSAPAALPQLSFLQRAQQGFTTTDPALAPQRNAIVLGTAGGLVEAGGGFAGALQQRRQARQFTSTGNQLANDIQTAAREEFVRLGIIANRQAGTQRAQIGAAGISISGSTAGDVVQEDLTEATLERELIVRRADEAAVRIRRQARRQSRAAKDAATIQAVTAAVGAILVIVTAGLALAALAAAPAGVVVSGGSAAGIGGFGGGAVVGGASGFGQAAVYTSLAASGVQTFGSQAASAQVR